MANKTTNGAELTQASSSNLEGSSVVSLYAKANLPLLLEFQASVAEELAAVKKRQEAIDEAIALRVSSAVKAARDELQKNEGTVNAVVDGCEVKSTVPKRVDWDSKKLMLACEKIAQMGEEPSKWIDFKLSVSERKYDVLPSAIHKLVADARTLKHGKEVLAITPVKAEAAE